MAQYLDFAGLQVYDTNIKALINNKADIISKTTAQWTTAGTATSVLNTIYIYSDYKTKTVNNATVNIPGIKIGDSTTTISNLPFIDDAVSPKLCIDQGFIAIDYGETGRQWYKLDLKFDEEATAAIIDASVPGVSPDNSFPLFGYEIWSDGDNTYYSNSGWNFVYDPTNQQWKLKTWNGLTNFQGNYVWKDFNGNIYYSNTNSALGTVGHYVLDKTTSTWTVKTWTGLTELPEFNGRYTWLAIEHGQPDNTVYYSQSSANTQYWYDDYEELWRDTYWTEEAGGKTVNVRGDYVWTDGTDTYYSVQGSYNNGTYVLYDGYFNPVSTNISSFDGDSIWSDGENIYLSRHSNIQYILDKSSSTTSAHIWKPITWVGYSDVAGDEIWSDGTYMHYSHYNDGNSETVNYILI